jgi:uncharacterized protein (TIGR03067 family)
MTWKTLILAGLVAVAAEDEATKKDLKAMQGTWKAQSMTQGGMEVPADKIVNHRLVIEGNKLMPKGSGKEDPGTFTLDASKKPPTIDIKHGTEEVVQGIYQLDGDTLKICLTPPGGTRPEEFASRPGTKVMLIVLTREKK